MSKSSVCREHLRKNKRCQVICPGYELFGKTMEVTFNNKMKKTCGQEFAWFDKRTFYLTCENAYKFDSETKIMMFVSGLCLFIFNY